LYKQGHNLDHCKRPASARGLLIDLLAVVDGHRLAADAPLGRELRAHLQGTLTAMGSGRAATPAAREVNEARRSVPVDDDVRDDVDVMPTGDLLLQLLNASLQRADDRLVLAVLSVRVRQLLLEDRDLSRSGRLWK